MPPHYLILTPWVLECDHALELFGPEGIEDMAWQVIEAYRADIDYRVYGLETANNQGWRVNAGVVDEGVVYEDDDIRVEGFRRRDDCKGTAAAITVRHMNSGRSPSARAGPARSLARAVLGRERGNRGARDTREVLGRRRSRKRFRLILAMHARQSGSEAPILLLCFLETTTRPAQYGPMTDLSITREKQE